MIYKCFVFTGKGPRYHTRACRIIGKIPYHIYHVYIHLAQLGSNPGRVGCLLSSLYIFHCFSSEYQLLVYFAIRIILQMILKGDKHVNAVKEIPKLLRDMSQHYINT